MKADSEMSPSVDVAVVGFGPVGAVMAGLLAKRGLRVLVIEKDRQVFPLPRAAHVDHTGLRAVQELGCLEQILRNVVRNKRLDLLDAQRRVLARIPADQPSVSGLPTSVYFYQPEFDSTLRDTVAAFENVEVRLGEEMTRIEADPRGVTLHTRTDSGDVAQVRAAWVVGCDGAWSPVREAMGIKLVSLNFDEQWLVLDLKVDVAQTALPADHVVEVCDPARPHLSTPIASDRQRFEFMLLPGEDPEQMKQEAVYRRLLKPWLAPGSYSVERAAIYTFHGLVAERWRIGRVLIAGDAAHQTPPFLGQGMCAGFRDAVNLAWKLARVVQANAPEELLDTYQTERSPHARKVIEVAIRIGRVICELDPAKAAARDQRLLANDPQLKADLAFKLPRLEPGPLVRDGGGGLFVQPIVRGQRLDDLVGPRFLIVARDASALGETASWWRQELDARVMTLSEFDDPAAQRWLHRHQADVVVVRPDRYVLACGTSLDQITAPVKVLLAGAGSKSNLRAGAASQANARY